MEFNIKYCFLVLIFELVINIYCNDYKEMCILLKFFLRPRNSLKYGNPVDMYICHSIKLCTKMYNFLAVVYR